MQVTNYIEYNGKQMRLGGLLHMIYDKPRI